MRRVLLDTSAYSMAFRGHAAVKETLQSAEQIFLNPIVLGELRAGFLHGKRSTENETDLQDFLASPRLRVLAIDGETSRHYAHLVAHLKRKGTPLPTNDLWIASSALQHDLELVTGDADFLRIPGLLIAPLQDR